MKNFIFTMVLCLHLQTAFAGNLIPLNTIKFQEVLASKKQKKVLFFFTSWCAQCKTVSLSKDLPKDKMVFISLDAEEEAIANFVKQVPYDIYYIKPDDNFENILQLSSNFGIKLATLDANKAVSVHYPYIACLDANNKVMADNITKENIHNYCD